ncbi:MBL fold metallo-hydrolase [Nanoarchaeota archaeon]
MAKIIFLGTGGDKSVIGRQIRASGGIILQISGLQIHLDPGPGSLNQAKDYGVNIRANDVILVSHNHIGHCNDLNAVIDAMTISGMDKKGVLITNSTVVNGEEDYQPYLTNYHKNCLEKIIILKPGQKVGVEDIEIHATFTQHSDPHTIGFRIVTPKFILGYTSDTNYHKELVNSFENTDILIINTTLPGDQKSDYHLNKEKTIKLIEKVKPRLAVIQHFGFNMLKADPLLEAREIQRATGVQTITAKDGSSLTPSSYDARSQQQRLNTFTKEEQSPNQPNTQ